MMKMRKMNIPIVRTYSELIQLESFIDRFRYLKLEGVVGEETFGCERFLNQALYRCPEWKSVRRKVILRDHGCDLGVDGYEIQGKILVHHMNPITIDDIRNRNPLIFDLENLITISHNTHNAVTYGSEEILVSDPIIRTPNDMCPWKK